MGKSLRSWATPLVFGSFTLMAVSGVMMFFHLNTDLSKGLHEWAGFALVAGAVAHLVQNRRAFLSYLRRPLALGIMGVGVAVTLVSLAPVGGAGEGRGGIGAILTSVGDAPVPVLASLTGQDVDRVMAELAGAGFAGVTESATIHALAGDDMGAQIAAMEAVFPQE